MNELSETLQKLVKTHGFSRTLRTLARLADEVADSEIDGKSAAFQSVGGRLRGAAQLLQNAKGAEQQAETPQE